MSIVFTVHSRTLRELKVQCIELIWELENGWFPGQFTEPGNGLRHGYLDSWNIKFTVPNHWNITRCCCTEFCSCATVLSIAPLDKRYQVCLSLVCSYQIVEKKFLPKPEWSLHYPVSSDQGYRGNDQTPPCQSAQLSVRTITAPVGTKPIIYKWSKNNKASAAQFSSSVYPILFTWLIDPLIGGQHLNCVAPAGMFSAHRLR